MRARASKVIAAVAMGLTLSMVAPVVAGASPPSRSVHSYRESVQAIDHRFIAAVLAAKRHLAASLRVAATPGQRTTARARYGLAIALATTARDEALVELGQPPKGAPEGLDVPAVTVPGD